MDEQKITTLFTESFNLALRTSKISAASFLGLAVLLQAFSLTRQNTSDHSNNFIRFVCTLAAMSLASQLTLLAVLPGPPTKIFVLLAVGLSLLLFTLVFQVQKNELRTAYFLSTCGSWFLVVVGSYLVPLTVDVRKIQMPMLTAFHVATSIVSSALFIGALLSSAIYLLSFQLLKKKKLNENLPIPSLQSLDKFTEKTLLLGLICMTVSLISGLGLIFENSDKLDVSAFKFVWAFGVWGFYALVIFGRAHWSWQGRKGALLSVWGAFFMMITLFGTLWGAR
jgi:ABC-type uncharacterized transport system permease subunit